MSVLFALQGRSESIKKGKSSEKPNKSDRFKASFPLFRRRNLNANTKYLSQMESNRSKRGGKGLPKKAKNKNKKKRQVECADGAGKACQFYWRGKLKWKAQTEWAKAVEGGEQSGAINWNEIANCISSVKQREKMKNNNDIDNNNNNNNTTSRLLIRIPLICLVVFVVVCLLVRLKNCCNAANCQVPPAPFPNTVWDTPPS